MSYAAVVESSPTVLGLAALRSALQLASSGERTQTSDTARLQPSSSMPRPRTEPAMAHATTGGESGPSPHGSAPQGPDSIWDVVRRAQNGDAEAFGEIYDQYVTTVHRYIFFRVNNRQLAEDLTSEAFLRALRRISSVSWQGRDLGAWLVTIARNLIADHYKSGRYRLEISTADMLDEDREDCGYGARPEAEALDRLTNETLLGAVKRLNPEQQECVVLRFLHGMSVAETASIMGKNDGAIKALQYRAVRSLGRLLPEGCTP